MRANFAGEIIMSFITATLRRAAVIGAFTVSLLTAFAHADERPIVEIITDRGIITLEVMDKLAPRTAANFLTLIDNKFYDGLVFHRVIANFMIQGGGYTADLTYKPGPGVYRFGPPSEERATSNEPEPEPDGASTESGPEPAADASEAASAPEGEAEPEPAEETVPAAETDSAE